MRGQQSHGLASTKRILRNIERSPSTFSKLAVPDMEHKFKTPPSHQMLLHPYADEEVDVKIRAFRQQIFRVQIPKPKEKDTLKNMKDIVFLAQKMNAGRELKILALKEQKQMERRHVNELEELIEQKRRKLERKRERRSKLKFDTNKSKPYDPYTISSTYRQNEEDQNQKLFGSSSEEEIDEKLDQILSENSERMKQFTRQRTLNQYRTRSEEEKVDERESNYQGSVLRKSSSPLKRYSSRALSISPDHGGTAELQALNSTKRVVTRRMTLMNATSRSQSVSPPAFKFKKQVSNISETNFKTSSISRDSPRSTASIHLLKNLETPAEMKKRTDSQFNPRFFIPKKSEEGKEKKIKRMNLRDFLILKHNLQPEITKPKIGERASVSPVRDISKDSAFSRKKIFLTKALAYMQNKLHSETEKVVEEDPFQRKRGNTIGGTKGKLVAKSIKQLQDYIINVDEPRIEEPRQSVGSNRPDGLYMTAINSNIHEASTFTPVSPIVTKTPKLEKVFSAPDLGKVADETAQKRGNKSPFNLVYQSQTAYRKPIKNFYLRNFKKQIHLEPCPVKPVVPEAQTTKNEKRLGRKPLFTIKLNAAEKHKQMRGLLPPIISPKKPVGMPTLRKVSSTIIGRSNKEQSNDQNYDRFFFKVEGILQGAQRYVSQVTKKRKYKLFTPRKKAPQKVEGILGTQQFVMEATNSEIDLLEKSDEK